MSRRHKAHICDRYSTLPDRRVVSTNEATVNLILAVRKQAILDERLDDWNIYWLGTSQIAKTLNLLYYLHLSANKTFTTEFGPGMASFSERA